MVLPEPRVEPSWPRHAEVFLLQDHQRRGSGVIVTGDFERETVGLMLEVTRIGQRDRIGDERHQTGDQQDERQRRHIGERR